MARHRRASSDHGRAGPVGLRPADCAPGSGRAERGVWCQAAPTLPGFEVSRMRSRRLVSVELKPAENVAHLLFCVQRRFIEADERVARPEVLPYVVVRLHVGKADRRSGGKAPGPFGRTYKDAAQGGVEPAGLVDDIRHLHEGGAEDDGAQVGVLDTPAPRPSTWFRS